MYETTILLSPGLSAVALAEPSVSAVRSHRQPMLPTVKSYQEPDGGHAIKTQNGHVPQTKNGNAPQTQKLAPLQAEASLRAEETRHLEAIRGNLEELGQKLSAQQQQRLKEMQQVAVQLATCMASCLLQRRLESDETILENLVGKAIQFLEPSQAVTVFLHPQDLSLLQKRFPDGLVPENNLELRLEADPSLSRGDCRAETGDVAVLSSWKTRLEAISQELLLDLAEAEVERRAATEPCLRRFPDRRQRA